MAALAQAVGMQLWQLVDRMATPLTALYSWVVSASHATSQAYRRAPTMSAHHLKGGYGAVRGRVSRPPSSFGGSQGICVREVRGAGRLVPAALICAAPWPMRRREQLAELLGQLFQH